MKIAIYPGSFDPITLGHMDIIRRAAQCFDQVYVCVLVNCDKKPMFSADERVDMIRRSVADLPNVTAEHYSGLLAAYAREKGVQLWMHNETGGNILSIRWPASTGASARGWKRFSFRPVPPTSISAAPWSGK